MKKKIIHVEEWVRVFIKHYYEDLVSGTEVSPQSCISDEGAIRALDGVIWYNENNKPEESND